METHVVWVKAIGAALAGLAARVVHMLFGADAAEPPDDPAARRRWHRRRVWLVIGELGALPAIALGWALAAEAWALPLPVVVFGALASGALGVGFLIDALQRFALARVGGGNGANGRGS